MVKKLPATAGDTGSILGSGKLPWRREWHSYSSILAWEIPRTGKPGGLQFTGPQKSQTQLIDKTTTISIDI